MDVFHMPTFFLIHLSQSAKLLISLCKLESSYEIMLPISTRYTFFLKLSLIDLIYPPSKHFMMILILVLIH